MTQKIIVHADGSLELPGIFQKIIKDPAEIMSIKVVDKKTTIQFKNGECWEKTLGLSDFELVLDMQETFYRSCDNSLINMHCVKKHRRNKRAKIAVLFEREASPGVEAKIIEADVSVRKVKIFLERYHALHPENGFF
jgi:hypothetical protein